MSDDVEREQAVRTYDGIISELQNEPCAYKRQCFRDGWNAAIAAMPQPVAEMEGDRMTDNVIPLGNITRLDLPTDRVLDGAKNNCSEGVVVLGFDDEGELYFASSIADGGTVIWLLEQAKLDLLKGGDV